MSACVRGMFNAGRFVQASVVTSYMYAPAWGALPSVPPATTSLEPMFVPASSDSDSGSTSRSCQRLPWPVMVKLAETGAASQLPAGSLARTLMVVSSKMRNVRADWKLSLYWSGVLPSVV